MGGTLRTIAAPRRGADDDDDDDDDDDGDDEVMFNVLGCRLTY